jgi:hypothetical protein
MKSPLLTAKYKRAKVPACASMTTVSMLTGIDKNLLRITRKKGLLGFSSNGQIVWRKFKPEFEKRYAELAESLKEDSIGLKAELQRRDIRLKDLQIRKLEGNLIDPDDFKLLLVEWGTAIGAVIKKELDELVPRVIGKSETDCLIEADKALAGVGRVINSWEPMLARLMKKTT